MVSMTNHEWLTVIIPAYNEAPRIGKVLNPLRDIKNLAAIIVVDDGSTDGTAGVIHRYMRHDPRLQLVRLQRNQGKAAAMVSGAETSPTDLIVFLDADLVGLTPAHVKALIEPVQSGRCDASVAIFRKGRLYTDLSHIVLPSVSGQRCVHWHDFASIPGLREVGYGVEMVLDGHIRKQGLRCEYVVWEGVTHVTKEGKVGLRLGVRGRLLADVAIARWYVKNLLARMRGEWREAAS